MSFANWLKLIRDAKKTSMITGKIRKIHYTFPNGKEMVEEYSMETGVVQRRCWKLSKELMGDPKWEIELGEELNIPGKDPSFSVREDNESPTLTKRITKKNIEWRIRNLPYPIENYQVSADPDKNCIIVRTTNKKYYKIITVPELERCSIQPKQENIAIFHQYSTLIITVNPN